MASVGGRQDSPMIDEVLDSEDSVIAPNTSTTNTTNLLNELTANDKIVHIDFQNNFQIDLFNDKDLQ